MTDIPILFSAEMVRAWLSGDKRMTRRLAWRQPSAKKGSLDLWATRWRTVKPGDRLWVRENFSGPHGIKGKPKTWPRETPIWYWAVGNPDFGDWTEPKPSIHLPRWASRLTLIVEAVKIEPLHAITIEDVIAEGIPPGAPLSAFPDLWTRLHGRGTWEANPEVVAISARSVPLNIDAMAPGAPPAAVEMVA